MRVTTRFAPSPTGRLHLGHAYSAIAAHDFARRHGGRFLLRIEDIDATRSRDEHIDAILDDLAWLGIDWDAAPVRQSRRLGLYADALARLRAAGLVYPCFCTRADIARDIADSGAAPHGAALLYPGTCRRMAADVRAARLESEPHAWRLDMAQAIAHGGVIDWHDAQAGRVLATPQMHGDVVLARKDAPTSYHLAVVVDDAAQGISHVVRGADLFNATHIHRLLQALLGLPTPHYAHHPLLTDAAGRRLAKRDGAPTIASLRAAGVDPEILVEGLRTGRLPIGFDVANA